MIRLIAEFTYILFADGRHKHIMNRSCVFVQVWAVESLDIAIPLQPEQSRATESRRQISLAGVRK
jgi:hypothetical protein